MRYLALCSVLWLCCAACKDEDAHVDQHSHNGPSDEHPKDAGPSKDAAVSSSTLRPSLPRPPKGLPAELRPPR
ncbi:MAG TPA: hypothetical protein VFN67_33990 [Polyangiales bacterium]|nr:hypothetical protein [Polyangiales bacterium]